MSSVSPGMAENCRRSERYLARSMRSRVDPPRTNRTSAYNVGQSVVTGERRGNASPAITVISAPPAASLVHGARRR